MGINQAIYTSSVQGIDKGGGMGIHSYNKLCSSRELQEFELSYCQYYFSGNEKEILALPVKIMYGKTQDEHYIISCVTYLGKDYDKEKGRMGNILSHMYSFTKDCIHYYPVQLYGSSIFKTSIALEEVNGTRPVDYLPDVADVKKGSIVDIEQVQDFLSSERMTMFCHLMAAVLNRDTIHKVIIYDTHKNIVLWLGAIELALPLKCALEVTFSSYEYDPTMSEFDIRGAVAGMSRGTCEDYASGGQFYVFDGINGNYPQFDISDDYFKYGIEIGLAFSYDSMTEFFEFLERYNYEKADYDIFQGFKLYQMVEGGMGQLNEKEFQEAISFESKYGNNSSYKKMITELVEKLEGDINFDKNLFLNVRFLLSEYLEKKLTEDELESALSLIIRIDKYISRYKQIALKRNAILQPFYEIMSKLQDGMIDVVNRYFARKNLYPYLADFEAYICVKRQNTSIQMIPSIFNKYWIDFPVKEYVYFDNIIYAAYIVLNEYEDCNEKYKAVIDLLIWIDTTGEKYIAGKGCEHLIQLMEELTNIMDKKQFAKKHRGNEEFENKQMQCTISVINYTLRNRVNLPIGKIKLRYVGNCIADACIKEIPLTKVKMLNFLASYPICNVNITSDELKNYIVQISKIMGKFRTEKDEYLLLLEIYNLNESQKKIILETFMDNETDSFRKEKDIKNLNALLTAVKELGDEDYQKALDKYVSGMKTSHREKISESIDNNCGLESYQYWISMVPSDESKTEKKGFFRRGKRQNT